MKTIIRLILLPAFLCLVVAAPQAQAQRGCNPAFTTTVGCDALFSNTTGTGDSAFGWRALFSNSIGSFNTGLGAGALSLNDADSNTAVGAAALLLNTTGTLNTAVGTDALVFNDSGSSNTANGANALFDNITGSQNTAIGNSALSVNTADNNTAVGSSALASNTTGTGNIGLGVLAGSAVTDATSVIAIGADAENVSNSCYIGQIYSNIQPQIGVDPDLVTISSSGRLGRANVSSRRYKHDIEPMDTASEAIYELKPVSFRYNKQYDATQTLAFGLIAEEVAEVNPDLVGRNREGQPESVRYEQINAMLLNEFLKEHQRVEQQDCKIQEQGTIIAELKSELKTLVTTVNGQASQLQKVSAQLQINNRAAQSIAESR